MTTKSKESKSKVEKEQSETKKVGGGTKTHPVTPERLKAAEDVIRSKNSPKDVHSKAREELKKRAAEAKKKRAQEKILEKGFVSDPTHPFERLADTMDSRARRWEIVVYPTLFAFILLAAFGFYLIYNLTRDISVLSKSVEQMATVINVTMPSMSDQMNSLKPMNNNLASMTNVMNSMNRSVYGLHRDVGNMNHTVSSGPMGFMNDMMPFSSNSYAPNPPPVFRPPLAAPVPNRMVIPNTTPPAAVQNQKTEKE